MLGGSSGANYSAYQRGRPEDWQLWSEKVQDDSFSYASVLEIFKMAETNSKGESKYHGVSGPVSVVDTCQQYPSFVERWKFVSVQLGLPFTEDVNGHLREGFEFEQSTLKDGRRVTTHNAYLLEAMSRRNLTVLCHTFVLRILMHHRQAAAVEAVRSGIPVLIKARREIIVSAGALRSPQLLMLSGIGDEAQLQHLEIPRVLHCPAVGRNLMDNVWVNMDFAIDLTSQQKEEFRSRPAVMFRSSPSLPAPDLFCTFYATGTGLFAKLFLLSHHCRGSISLHNKDPLEPPVIRMNLKFSEQELKSFLLGIKFVRKVVTATVTEQMVSEVTPALENDVELLEWIRNTCQSVSHYAGTCAMGLSSAGNSVVDSHFSVHGISGLRVVDASVIPVMIHGGTFATVLMLGEKAAACIAADALQYGSSHLIK
eukprot:GILJ01013804.1.p1 GENE.GILJ01013804.1~~GILJ01013804.1.p1  ORF type:complete len:471 (-),score=52.37 GILJ01013804.1:541-1815(-)